MKKLYLLYLLSLFSLVGCKKDSFEYKSIIGTWEIRAYISSFTGKTTYAPGNGNIVKFGATSYKTQ